MAMTPEKRAEMSARMKERWAKRKTETQSAPSAPQPEPVRVQVTETAGGTPRNLFSGFVKKFDVLGKNGSYTDPIPGYRLYAFLDREGGMRISQALASGWQFVTRDEVILNDAWNTDLNTDLGSKIRIYGGTGEDNKPLHHYLMKKPLELCKIHDQERENYHLQIEAALRAGTFNMGAGEKRYTSANPPQGSPSGLPPISISPRLAR